MEAKVQAQARRRDMDQSKSISKSKIQSHYFDVWQQWSLLGLKSQSIRQPKTVTNQREGGEEGRERRGAKGGQFSHSNVRDHNNNETETETVSKSAPQIASDMLFAIAMINCFAVRSIYPDWSRPAQAELLESKPLNYKLIAGSCTHTQLHSRSLWMRSWIRMICYWIWQTGNSDQMSQMCKWLEVAKCAANGKFIARLPACNNLWTSAIARRLRRQLVPIGTDPPPMRSTPTDLQQAAGNF